jgi:DNA-binding LytR/AlgR family response regulator
MEISEEVISTRVVSRGISTGEVDKEDFREARHKHQVLFLVSCFLYLYYMNCLIVDDNKIARTTLKQLASQVKDIVVCGECENAMDAYNMLQEQPVDLLLLDIEMPGMSGIELTKNLGAAKPVIIFTTSKKDYAAEAFELNVADYIVKPVTPPRFIQAIEKARAILDSNKEDVEYSDDEFIFIRDSNIVRRLKLDDIYFVEAMGDYVKIYTEKKFYAIHTTLRAVESRLPSSRFLRVHRSYLVAVSKIDTIQEGALIVNGKPLPVADAYRASLNRRMNIL